MKLTYQIPQLSQEKPVKKAAYHRVYKKLRRTHIKIIIAILKFIRMPFGCRPGQELLALIADCCRKTVNELCQEMRQLGILSWVENHRHAHQYFFPDLFKTLLNLKKMGILVVIPLLSCLTAEKHDKHRVTPLRELIHSDLSISKNQSSHSSTSYLESISSGVMITVSPRKWQEVINGPVIYRTDYGPTENRLATTEREAIFNSKKGPGMREKQLKEIYDRIQLSDEDVDTVERCSDDVITRVHKNIESALKSNRPSSYFMKMVSNAIKEVPKQQGARRPSQEQAPRRPIDQALLQTLAPEQEKKRAQEKREAWEAVHGPKKHDAFYVEKKPVRPSDDLSKFYTADWCQQRLIEDLKILEIERKNGTTHPFMQGLLRVVKERVVKCQAILEEKNRPKEPEYVQVSNPQQTSLFGPEEPISLEYEQLDEIF